MREGVHLLGPRFTTAGRHVVPQRLAAATLDGQRQTGRPSQAGPSDVLIATDDSGSRDSDSGVRAALDDVSQGE
jgi:hypothetical protein